MTTVYDFLKKSQLTNCCRKEKIEFQFQNEKGKSKRKHKTCTLKGGDWTIDLVHRAVLIM